MFARKAKESGSIPLFPKEKKINVFFLKKEKKNVKI